MREVFVENNGTIFNVEEITVENKAGLYLWSYGRTEGNPEGHYTLTNLSIKAGGHAEALTADLGPMIQLVLTRLTINGNGDLRTNRLKLNAVNITVDLSGETKFHR